MRLLPCWNERLEGQTPQIRLLLKSRGQIKALVLLDAPFLLALHIQPCLPRVQGVPASWPVDLLLGSESAALQLRDPATGACPAPLVLGTAPAPARALEVGARPGAPLSRSWRLVPPGLRSGCTVARAAPGSTSSPPGHIPGCCFSSA